MAIDNPVSINLTSTAGLCFAGAMGAFLTGLGDLMSNDPSSLVSKLGEVFFGTRNPGLVSLVPLMLLGIFSTWINNPRTKIEAFQLGLAVFALLNTAIPSPHKPNKSLDGDAKTVAEIGFLQNISGVGEAYAEPSGSEPLGSFSFKIESSGASNSSIEQNPNPKVWVTIRDENSNILGENWIQGGTEIRRPPGIYILDMEAPGYKSSRYKIEIPRQGEGAQQKKNIIVIEPSKIPLPLQRLFPPGELSINQVPPIK